MADLRQRWGGAIRSFIVAEPETWAKKFATHTLGTSALSWGRSKTKSSQRVGHEYGSPYNRLTDVMLVREESHCRFEVSAATSVRFAR